MQTHSLNRHLIERLVVLVALAALVAGCASGGAYGRGARLERAGDWDAAVEQYRQAVLEEPNRTEYQIALQRAMLAASRLHLDQARLLEAKGQLEDSLREYRRASEFDPPNRQVAGKVLEIEKRIRDEAEAARPTPTITQLRERARPQEPLLNPASREPLNIRFNNASIRDILNFVGNATGINVTYDRDFQDRSYTVQLDGVTLEQALTQILTANQFFYKVINDRTIMVIPDTQQKRAQYEEQVIRTFFISHADATELAQIVNQVVRVPAMPVQPLIAANKTNNTITIRATTNVAAIIERIIDANDTPRAEIVIDLQIMEVNRTRAKTFGLNLSSYSITGVFSPESDPRTASSGDDSNVGTGLGAGSTFNLNTITRGISTADFYLAVPSAVVRFLEADAETKLIAKPQLRGAEGQKITLNLGDEIPVPATVFTPVAQGGANFNPLTSFNYRPVGVNVEMTPRVTFEGEIVLDVAVESSTLGRDVNIAGQNLPSFGSRKVNTRLRLRDGESNLLAGLLREDERRAMQGVPGIQRVPILRQLFGSTDSRVDQTDIVMLLTPRIVRTHELSQQDVNPIYIGTQQNMGLGGPPPLIAVQEPEPAPGIPATPAPQAGLAAPATAPPGTGGVVVVPPGSNTVPGTTTIPAAPAAAALAPPPGASPETGGQIVLTAPTPEFRVGSGPYTVPLSVAGASRLSTLSLTVTFNPSALRVRAVQEGTFFRTGGATATFAQQVDATAGRIDIAIVRTGDATGVSGAGLLAALLFEAIAPGPANLTITGTGSAPGGAGLPLVFGPAPAVVVR
jgi:type II secretory pathway component GspD/PulD (secretin)